MDRPTSSSVASAGTDAPAAPPRLRDIFWVFCQIGEMRKRLTATEFLSGLPLVQALPGVNMTNMSVYVGQRLRGVPGVLTALFGLLIGPFFILIALSTAYHTI